MISDSIVGQAVPELVVDIERGRLALFAKAIGETSPDYLDVDAARGAGHPDLPVPPTFLMGLAGDGDSLMQLLVGAGADLRYGLHGEQSFRYHRMAHAGDRLRLKATIGDVYQKRGGALEFVVTDTSVFDDRDGTRVADLRTVMVFRIPEGAT